MHLGVLDASLSRRDSREGSLVPGIEGVAGFAVEVAGLVVEVVGGSQSLHLEWAASVPSCPLPCVVLARGSVCKKKQSGQGAGLESPFGGVKAAVLVAVLVQFQEGKFSSRPGTLA